MKPQKRTASTRELGLDIALIVARYLFQTDHLHYGYWTPELRPHMNNLRQAQEVYTNILLQHIPAGVVTILDVGAGTGILAERLLQKGYTVDCVSPSAYQAMAIRERLGKASEVFECCYEDLKTDKHYDLILFSESFQYIPLERGMAMTCGLLNADGYLLICDFFRREIPGRGPMGGGHSFSRFCELAREKSLQLREDHDITEQMAPNLDLVQDCVMNVLLPIKERLFQHFGLLYPLPFRGLCWIFRKSLQRLETKYFTGQRSGENFKIYKTYRCLLFQQSVRQPSEKETPLIVGTRKEA